MEVQSKKGRKTVRNKKHQVQQTVQMVITNLLKGSAFSTSLYLCLNYSELFIFI